jgi:signal transduction histidine kinase
MDPSLGVMKTAEKTLDRVSYELTSFYNAQGTLNYLRSLRNVLFLCCFAALFVLLPISFIFTRILLKPFRTLAQQTSQLSAEKLSYRFEKPKFKDELGTLTLNFNLLLDKLESSFEQIKNFTANASHEIRTPLTAIIVQLQMLERKPEFKAEPTGTIKKVLNQAFHLKDIVNKLLLLFEVERIEKEKTLSNISIKEAISQALETLKFKYKKDEFDISHPEEDVYFLGNETLISCIVANIIENALKYSFSQIKISTESSPSTLDLIVEDDGPGIQETQTAKLSDGESHGLGLSIVKACLQSLSGKISFEKSQLGGLKVKVTLPRNDLNLHSIDHLESATL